MLYSIDDYKNLTPSQIVMGNAEDYATVNWTNMYSVYFNEKEESPLTRNVLYIFNYYYATTGYISSYQDNDVTLYFNSIIKPFNAEMMCIQASWASHRDNDLTTPRAMFVLNSQNYVSESNITSMLRNVIRFKGYNQPITNNGRVEFQCTILLRLF